MSGCDAVAVLQRAFEGREMKTVGMLVRSLSLAICGNGWFAWAAQAKPIAAETLRNMSESGAVRVSCGIGFSTDMNDFAAGAINTGTQIVVGIGIALLLVIAVRLLPKHRRDIAWRCVATMACVIFLGGIVLAMTAAGLLINNVTSSILFASALIAIPSFISGCCRLLWSGMKLITELMVKGRQVTVAITENEVILREGDSRVTRRLAEIESHTGEEACATK